MPFDYKPTLIGKLIKLRPLVKGDFNDLYYAAKDPLIWQLHPQKDRYKKSVFNQYFHNALHSKGALVVIDLNTNTIIGSSRFHDFNALTSEVEIGWSFLRKAYWGGTYNKEMKQLMLQHAFESTNKVIFSIGTLNLRSQKAIEKIGGELLKTKHPKAINNNIIYQITKTNYEKNYLKLNRA